MFTWCRQLTPLHKKGNFDRYISPLLFFILYDKCMFSLCVIFLSVIFFYSYGGYITESIMVTFIAGYTCITKGLHRCQFLRGASLRLHSDNSLGVNCLSKGGST